MYRCIEQSQVMLPVTQVTLVPVPQFKYLVIIVDSNLSF